MSFPHRACQVSPLIKHSRVNCIQLCIIHQASLSLEDVFIVHTCQLFKLTHHIFHTPRFPHSAFSTLRVFHTQRFPHSAFSTLRVFHTPRFPHSSHNKKKATKHPIPPVIFYIKNVLLWLSHLKLNSRARLVLESLHS